MSVLATINRFQGRAYAVLKTFYGVVRFGELLDSEGKTDGELISWAAAKRKTRMRRITERVEKLRAQILALETEHLFLAQISGYGIKEGL